MGDTDLLNKLNAELETSRIKFPVYLKKGKITKIDLSYYKLLSLPESISKFTDLETLDLSNNHLQKLPDSINKLKNLVYLDISHNQLWELPKAIKKLKKLKILEASSNQLEYLPDSISKLENLKGLYLHYNLLKEIPKSIGKLRNLEKLNLMGNNLSELPISMKHLNLKSLNLAFNDDLIKKLDDRECRDTWIILNPNGKNLPEAVPIKQGYFKIGVLTEPEFLDDKIKRVETLGHRSICISNYNLKDAESISVILDNYFRND